MTHPPRHEVPNLCSKHGGGWAFTWRNRGSALQTNRPRRAPSYEVAATGKNPSKKAPGVWQLVASVRLPRWAAVVGGWGAASRNLIRHFIKDSTPSSASTSSA
jgi:hypothetical protein